MRPHASTHPTSLTAPSGILSIILIAATHALQAPRVVEAGGQPLFIQSFATHTHTHTNRTHSHARTHFAYKIGAQWERANWIGISQKADLTLHYCVCASAHARTYTQKHQHA